MYINFTAIFLIVDTGYAYFQIKDENINFLLKAGYESKNIVDGNIFVIYDNFNSQELVNGQILFLNSDFFTSLDQISIAFPIPIVFNSYVTTENEIANLLYANLKLKKLMVEYEKLQNNSKELIADVKKKFIEEYQSYLKSEINNNNSSYYNLNEDLREATYKIGLISESSQHSVARNSISDPSGLISPFAVSQPKVSMNYKPSNFSIDNNSVDDKRNLLSENDTNKLKERQIRQDHSITDLTKIINNIIQYGVNHKGETFFYCVCLYFLLWLLSMVFRR